MCLRRSGTSIERVASRVAIAASIAGGADTFVWMWIDSIAAKVVLSLCLVIGTLGFLAAPEDSE